MIILRSGVLLSQIADADSFITESGDTYNIIYSPIIKDGSIDLVESGREDIATLINSHASQCDMSLIMARLAAGDASPLYARPAFYGDFSSCNYDHRAMLQTVIESHNYFDALSPDVRARFHDSFQEWYSTAGSPDWAKNMQAASSPSNPFVSSSAGALDPVHVVSTEASTSVNNEGGLAK